MGKAKRHLVLGFNPNYLNDTMKWPSSATTTHAYIIGDFAT
ncbi:MAG: hypothetical protein WAM14_10000 [Candidatus Nitrosopolaris sp.]